MAANTKQAQVQEIIRCGKDPAYFMNTYAKIQHPTRGLIPFSTYPFQDDCVKDFINHRFNIVLKSRQLGLSTLCAAYVAWLVLFYKDKNVLVIATKLDVAMNFVKKVKVLIANLPKWLVLPTIVSDNKQTIEFSHGSKLKAVPTSEDAGRSEALSLLIVDEAAFVRNFDTIWTGLYPTLSTGGQAIVLSTPNGVGGQYHKLYTDAEANLNEFNAIKLMWDVHPERDQAWFDKETRNLTKKQIAQELLCDFAASGETFLGIEDIEYIKTLTCAPKDRWGFDRNVWVWKMPLSAHKYILSADVARGDSADYSTFHVIDVDEAEVVAEYKGKIPPDKFGVLLNEIGRKFNNALLCPENNSFGFATIIKLKELGYPRIYHEQKKGNLIPVTDYIPPDSEDIAGFNTNAKTRNQILTKLEEVLRNKQLKIYSSRMYEELKTFVWSGNRAQAMKGHNDDLIMSLAIGVWLFDVSEAHSKHSQALNNVILSGMGTTAGQLEGFTGQVGNHSATFSHPNPYLPWTSGTWPGEKNPGTPQRPVIKNPYGWLF